MLIEIDEPATWPDSLRTDAERVAEVWRGSAASLDELELGEDDDDRLRSHLIDKQLLAFHATRLLPHEMDEVTRQGLRPLDERLVRDRLKAAREAGASRDQEEALLAQSALRQPRSSDRTGRLFLSLGEAALLDHRQVRPLLSRWGGEAIYWGVESDRGLSQELESLGEPTIVAARLRVISEVTSSQLETVTPPLSRLFVAQRLGLEKNWARVSWRSRIPSRDILHLWTSGRPEFQRRVPWMYGMGTTTQVRDSDHAGGLFG